MGRVSSDVIADVCDHLACLYAYPSLLSRSSESSALNSLLALLSNLWLFPSSQHSTPPSPQALVEALVEVGLQPSSKV